jgi:hypothetical protein
MDWQLKPKQLYYIVYSYRNSNLSISYHYIMGPGRKRGIGMDIAEQILKEETRGVQKKRENEKENKTMSFIVGML